MEEHPTEIFVRQEVPFDLGLVGTLMNEISHNLGTRASSSSSSHASLPPLTIATLDDVTSCLVLLRDYIAVWSQEAGLMRDRLEEQLRAAREQAADLRLQLAATLEESESSESSLLVRLQDSQLELEGHATRLQRASSSNVSLERELSLSRQRVRGCEAVRV